METHARYLLVGLFSIIVTILLITFSLWLGKLQLDREYQNYDVMFHESVSGLSVGGIVQYQGIQVGEVRKLSLDAKDPRQVAVRIRVSADTPVKVDTRAQLNYTGLTGVAVVELFGGTPGSKMLRDVDAHDPPRIETDPSTLSQLMSGSSGAVNSAQEVLARIIKVLSDENIAHVTGTLSNLEAVSADVKSDYPGLRDALRDIRLLEQKLLSAATRADTVLTQLQSGLMVDAHDPAKGTVFNQASAAIIEIQQAAKSVSSAADAIAVFSGDLKDESGKDLATMILQLRIVSENLARITEKLDQSPKDYLLGRDALPVYKPEKPAP